MLYRAIDFIPDEVAFLIKPGYTGYRILGTKDSSSWKPIVPTNEEMMGMGYTSQFKFVDPNEINKKAGYPPNYIMVKVGEKIKDKIAEHFTVTKVIKDLASDYMFEGDYTAQKQNDKI